MQNLFAAHWSNIRLGEGQQCNCCSFSCHELDLECRAIAVAMHHSPQIALFQATFFNVVYENNHVQFAIHVAFASSVIWWLSFPRPGYP